MLILVKYVVFDNSYFGLYLGMINIATLTVALRS